MEKRKIEVYIDGSSVDVNAKKRPKGTEPVFPEWHGAYAGVFLVDGVEVLRMKGYEKGGTIGKMELMGLVASLSKCIENGWSEAIIHSDSQYVVNGYNSWLKGWVKKGFVKIKFPDKWEYLWNEKNDADSKDIKVVWVKGHHECPGNHIADKLANKALGAGITGWKVSGKERFLLFDKVEGFMKSPNTGDMLPIHYDNDFTDMAKKKPMEKSEEDEAEDYYQAIADYRNSHPVDYDKEISDCYESIQKGLERLKQLLIKKR